MAPPYVQGGSVGPNVYDKLNVASMGKVTEISSTYNHGCPDGPIRTTW